MGDRLSYIVSHEAWYWSPQHDRPRTVAEVNVQRQALTDEGKDNGVHWEFMVRWLDLDMRTGPVPHVEMFDDSWQAFTELPGLFADLANLAKPGHDEASAGVLDICALLEQHGFVDITPRTSPYEEVSGG